MVYLFFFLMIKMLGKKYIGEYETLKNKRADFIMQKFLNGNENHKQNQKINCSIWPRAKVSTVQRTLSYQ